jgi:hypothetical protein
MTPAGFGKRGGKQYDGRGEERTEKNRLHANHDEKFRGRDWGPPDPSSGGGAEMQATAPLNSGTPPERVKLLAHDDPFFPERPAQPAP